MPVSSASARKTGPRPGFEGMVVSAIPVWLKDTSGRSTKYFDTRVEYDDGDGIKRAQVFVRAYEYLPPDALVRVQRGKTGRLRIRPDIDETPKAGSVWSKPDIKTGIIALLLGILLISAIVGGAFLYMKFSEGQVNDLIEQDKQRQQEQPTQPISPTPVQPTA